MGLSENRCVQVSIRSGICVFLERFRTPPGQLRLGEQPNRRATFRSFFEPAPDDSAVADQGHSTAAPGGADGVQEAEALRNGQGCAVRVIARLEIIFREARMTRRPVSAVLDIPRHTVERQVRSRVAEQHGEREDTRALVADPQLTQAELRHHDRARLVVVERRADTIGECGQPRRDVP
jgi:hypothetical protein